MSTPYSIHVVPDETTEGAKCYVAYHPELDGCMSHGSSVPEAIQGLEDARELYLKTLRELGQEAPLPSATPSVVIWENFPAQQIVRSNSRKAVALPVTELIATR